MHDKTLTLRITGFLSSLFLTLLAYFIIVRPEFFHFTPPIAVTVILTFAILQSLVQLIFFLLWKEEGPPWNLGFFISTVGIIFIVIFFSIWIMDHLMYYNAL